MFRHFVLLVTLASATSAYAHSITIQIHKDDRGENITSITVIADRSFANKQVTIVGVGDGGHAGTIRATADSDGKATFESPPTSITGASRGAGIFIEGHSSSWNNVFIKDDAEYLDNKQENDKYKQQNNIKLLNFDSLPFLLPFDAIDAFFADEESPSWEQIALLNSSDSAYQLTNFRLYGGLDPSFFAPGLFDSLAAIASGFLLTDYVDLVGTPLEIAGVGGEFLPRLTTSGPVLAPGYFLLTGTAREELAGGGFGAPVNFSVASRPVPEPSTLTLLGIAFASAAARARHLRSRSRRVVRVSRTRR